jgi:hypothetical protein
MYLPIKTLSYVLSTRIQTSPKSKTPSTLSHTHIQKKENTRARAHTHTHTAIHTHHTRIKNTHSHTRRFKTAKKKTRLNNDKTHAKIHWKDLRPSDIRPLAQGKLEDGLGQRRPVSRATSFLNYGLRQVSCASGQPPEYTN